MQLYLILDIVTIFALLVGFVFSLIQLRHYHLSREHDAALILLNSFQTSEFLEGVLKITQDLPHALPKSEIDKRFARDTRPLYLVMSTWERIGLLLYHHEVSLELVNQAYGERILLSWRKLEQYVQDTRVELERDRSFEWFQWLADRMEQYEKTVTTGPAYIAHRDWK